MEFLLSAPLEFRWKDLEFRIEKTGKHYSDGDSSFAGSEVRISPALTITCGGLGKVCDARNPPGKRGWGHPLGKASTSSLSLLLDARIDNYAQLLILLGMIKKTTKCCACDGCEFNGALQSRNNFALNPRNYDGYNRWCRACCVRTSNASNSKTVNSLALMDAVAIVEKFKQSNILLRKKLIYAALSSKASF